MTSSRKRAARPGTLHCRTYENLWNSKKKSFRLYWNKENKNSQQKNIYHCFSKEDFSSQAQRDSGANKLSRCAQTMSWKLSHIVWHIDIYWHGTITTGTCRLYSRPTVSCRTEDISQLIDVTVKFVVKIKRKDPIFDCSRTIWIYFLMSISEREKLFRSMMTLTLTCTAHVIQQLSTAKKNAQYLSTTNADEFDAIGIYRALRYSPRMHYDICRCRWVYLCIMCYELRWIY